MNQSAVNGTEVFHQELISDNQQIFERILQSINNAQQEILVATSWFTDDLLFNALSRKCSDGVKVDLILGDNQENDKLFFQELTDKGADVLKIRNVGYGIMHQKFCIIDRHLALHGSYNWSVNARKNNHESIIATTHKATVDSLVKTFFEIKERSIEVLNGGSPSVPSTIAENDNKKQEPTNVIRKELDIVNEFTRVLDSMIAAEVSNFDRNLLRKQGYERAKSNNGDAQVLGKAYDTVYSVFINEINVVEDKKKRLLTKIEEQKNRSLQAINETTDLEISTINLEQDNMQSGLSNKILRLKSDVSVQDNEINKIKTVQIPAIEDKNERLLQEISQLEQNHISPAWKLHEIVPISFLNFFLFMYLVLFYSSAAYILLFGEADAKQARMNGIQIPPPEVFDPEAISKVIEKGSMATLYVFLFVVLPVSFAVIRISRNKVISYIISAFLGVLLLDTFLAYKVAKSVHEIAYLTGKTDDAWSLNMILYDPNFYLVFILGAMGLILFKVAYTGLIEILDERSPDENSRKKRVAIKLTRDEISSNIQKILELNTEISTMNNKNISLKTEIAACEKELEVLPTKKAKLVENKRAEQAIKVHGIESSSVIYKSHVENDDVPVSIHSMKDRINIFLEGWTDWLYGHFAVTLAEEKCAQAVDAANSWLDEKMKQNNIDKRIVTSN
ncbi:DUF1669 domain-containing protein [Fulvivirgaceae bacterium PWU4]|uniref:phospholipase D n=1 Tax=Chryseosolibacter histidini TaxID=2782349 RepID=A0AAP2DGY1_9BACT|nr:phospholipase D-like domain-containing protein [Chryseosolibacter histidini]MBT1696181.1 DUF1669 domain-containing protein [Chryseosolibacter histidini]